MRDRAISAAWSWFQQLQAQHVPPGDQETRFALLYQRRYLAVLGFFDYLLAIQTWLKT